MASIDFNWDVFPSTKLEERHMVTPLGCMITPFEHPTTSISLSSPIACSSCGSYINSHIRIDRANRMWWCNMCSKMSFLPDDFNLHEKNSPDSGIPLEIRPTPHNTIDYVLSQDITLNTRTSDDDFIVTYVLDTYQHTEAMVSYEFNRLTDALAESVSRLPANTQILLITFSDIVEIHQPAVNNSIKFSSNSLFGNRTGASSIFTNDSVFDKITSSLRPTSANTTTHKDNITASKILSNPDKSFVGYIKGLKPKLTQSFKPPRATGLAMFVAASIYNRFLRKNSYGKIMAFLSGPATLNPGKIVGSSENIRSHREVSNFQAPHFISSSKFYRALGCMAVGYTPKQAYTSVYSSNGKLVDFSVPENTPKFSVDLYTGSLDQVGIYEMKPLVESGGGDIFTADSFASNYFVDSLQKNISNILRGHHMCKLTVLSSPGVKVMKLVANGTELQSSYQSEKLSTMHHENISDTVTPFDSSLRKKNDTNQWHLGSLSSNDTIALFLEMDTVSCSSRLGLDRAPSEVFIQFQFKFWSMAKNCMMLRIVTIKKRTTLAILAAQKVNPSHGRLRLLNTNSNIAKEMLWLEGFNAEVWMSLLARLLISKMDTTIGYESFEAVSDAVEKSLIRLLRYFGGVEIHSGLTENPHEGIQSVYSISARFTNLPALAYNLRRNPQLISIFNSSPDDTAYNHHIFSKCNPSSSCRMILPVLYQVKNDCLVGMELEMNSLTGSSEHVYFILDCVGQIIIFNRFSLPDDKLSLHHSNNDPEKVSKTNSQFGKVLSLVKQDLLHGRSANSRIIVTQSGHSQARFLFSRIVSSKAKQVDHAKQLPQKSKWWNFFTNPGSQNIDMTDDMSYSQFYDELLRRVETFSLEDDT